MDEREARERYLALHQNPLGMVMRGDCHCSRCTDSLDELVEYVREQGGYVVKLQPAASVRTHARRRGWV